ncbi:LPXTG cell wall anchor domain-containing protein [Rossellomorea vietnamensis]|uniref:LPXTG cell wall anchor domain-containing protein n=1 Tax=Rossellomorea vietnamensis TaxID=218284 RepID=A0A5D4NVS3_9BACI|nr:LPXTG cell wall anchor domain-containing protein [Rossellomorea vietnamensis]TYS17781.1 LPXTG cell wall anchor domain-containing protein [Rossellomorea vietnamensis]
MNKKQPKRLALMLVLSLILLNIAGASSAAADGNNTTPAENEESSTAANEMTQESMKSMLENDLEAVTFILEDGSKAKGELKGGEWMSQEVSGIGEVSGIEVIVDGETRTFDISEAGPDAGLAIINWMEQSVTFDTKVSEIAVQVPERAGELGKAEILLEDGSTIALDLGGITALDEAYDPENFSELRLVIDGEEFITDLSDSSNFRILYGGLVIQPELGGEEIAGVKIEAAEGKKAEAARLVLSDLSPVLLEKTEEGVFMTGGEEISSNEVVMLFLKIDGEEYTINLEDSDLELDEEGFLIISSLEENFPEGDEIGETTEESGMLPDTGDRSDAIFYLAGLLIISFGALNLRTRKFHKD